GVATTTSPSEWRGTAAGSRGRTNPDGRPHPGRPLRHPGTRIMAKTKTKSAAATADKPKEKKLPQKKVRRRNQVKKGKHGGTMVVLVDDLVHVGKQGDLVEVKPGYARNYLLPYGKAVVPSEQNLRTLEQYKIKVSKAREARIADLKVLAEQLSRLPAVTIEANAHEVVDESGAAHHYLYGSIGPSD